MKLAAVICLPPALFAAVEEAAEVLPAAARICEELLEAPDGVLIEVEEGDERVLISKVEGNLEIRARGPHEVVDVNLPLETVAEILDSRREMRWPRFAGHRAPIWFASKTATIGSRSGSGSDPSGRGAVGGDRGKQRGICPSCDAKRAAAFAAFLRDELLENVGHTLFTFTLPKMLRPYFMRHRELMGDLARLAYETLKQLMSEAVGDQHARPGVVAVPQTFGSLINPHPHAHCLASRLGMPKGRWLPVPYINTHAAERLFRLKVLRLLKRKGLLNDERIELMNSFRHSGFSVDASPTVWPQDAQELERLGRYLLRCPVSLSRVHWSSGAQGKSFPDDPLRASRRRDPRYLRVHRPRSHPDPY